MNVLIDTSVWSLALRKKTLISEEIKIVAELKELIYEKRVIIIGPIRQELLSGIKDINKYELLRNKMHAFVDENLNIEDFEKAAEINNLCRRNGIQGSHIDYLIVATAINRNIAIFTNDKDFLNYSTKIKMKLHRIRKEIEE